MNPKATRSFRSWPASSAHWWTDQPLYADYAPLDYFRYPPTFAIVFSPLWAVGPQAGGVLWGLLGAGVFVFGLWRSCATWRRPPGRRPGKRRSWPSGAGRPPRSVERESNALAVGLLLLAAAALVRRRWWTAAAVLAGSVLIKLTPLAPALLLCALQPRRLSGRFALILMAGLLLPFLTRPPDIVFNHYREWLNQMAATG